MKKIICISFLVFSTFTLLAQNVMTPEKLWELGRVSAIGISKDGNNLIYRVGTPSVSENEITSVTYSIPLSGGNAVKLENPKPLLQDKNLSPNGQYLLYNEEVKINKVQGQDYYPEMENANVQIYDALDYRHWDSYNEGKFNHVFYKEVAAENGIDIMKDEPHNTPQKPFGGASDYIWSPDSKKILYVSKKKTGTAYANSTNTDIYEYDLASQKTRNLTEGNPGYDTYPAFSPGGDLTWLQMKRDGYESDKNDIIVRHKNTNINLTGNWDNTVNSFKWHPDGKKIYFTAATNGTVQLFEANFPGLTKVAVTINQVTRG
ncbi:MAG: PD40 domain-containing protein, partial [Flavobacteriales bacterium]|nr:PD40 domain-containing protein [Flavobacteriales bacterium]